MPYRITPLVNDHYYHIYNRGTEKRLIFTNTRDFQRFLKTLNFYQYAGPKPRFSHYVRNKKFKFDPSKKIVEIICYCLMPNHFHLLVRQVKEGGVTNLMRNLSNSYTKYFNIKYKRVGPLLQGQFKAVLMENNEQLIHVSRYIHLNPISSLLVKDLNFYSWSSYNEYIKNSTGICIKEDILGFFKSIEAYDKFISDQVDYAQQLELIKHKVLEEI